MDRLNAIKKITTSFSFLTLAVILLLSNKILSLNLFKIITVSRPSTHLRVFLMRALGCPTKEENWSGSPCKPKNSLLLLDITPTKNLSPPVLPLITDHILEKRYL